MAVSVCVCRRCRRAVGVRGASQQHPTGGGHSRTMGCWRRGRRFNKTRWTWNRIVHMLFCCVRMQASWLHQCNMFPCICKQDAARQEMQQICCHQTLMVCFLDLAGRRCTAGVQTALRLESEGLQGSLALEAGASLQRVAECMRAARTQTFAHKVTQPIPTQSNFVVLLVTLARSMLN